ncbi:hypothetical protein Tco_1485050 [Tanacetum coccineum]
MRGVLCEASSDWSMLLRGRDDVCRMCNIGMWIPLYIAERDVMAYGRHGRHEVGGSILWIQRHSAHMIRWGMGVVSVQHLDIGRDSMSEWRTSGLRWEMMYNTEVGEYRLEEG